MKKRISALALCLLLVCAFPLTALAVREIPIPPELSVACERTDEETLSVTVSISANAGLSGFDIDLTVLGWEDCLASPVFTPGEAFADAYLDNSGESIPDSGVLTVVCAAEEDVVGNAALFTVCFTVTDGSFGSIAFTASGSVCNTAMDELAVSAADYAYAYGDLFSVACSLDDGKMLTADGSGISGTLGFTVASYDSGLGKGVGYTGAARAMLVCYEDGRFLGCRMTEFTVAENAETEVTLTGVSFRGTDAEKLRVQLLLTDAAFAPLCGAVTYVPMGES